MRLLLVDDEPLVLRGLRRALYTCDSWMVRTANSAAEALHILEREPIDVVITDRRMPRHDGVWLLDRIATRHPDALRVLLSGAPLGFDALPTTGTIEQCLPKPCQPEMLARLLTRIEDSRRRTPRSLRTVAATVGAIPMTRDEYEAAVGAIAGPDVAEAVAALAPRSPAVAARLLHLHHGLSAHTTDDIVDFSTAARTVGASALVSHLLAGSPVLDATPAPAHPRRPENEAPRSGELAVALALLPVGDRLVPNAPRRVGAWAAAHLFDRWGLPERLCLAIAHAARPSVAPDPHDPLLAALARLDPPISRARTGPA